MNSSGRWDVPPESLSDEMVVVMCRWVFRMRDRGFDLADTADEFKTDQDSILALLEEAAERGLVETPRGHVGN